MHHLTYIKREEKKRKERNAPKGRRKTEGQEAGYEGNHGKEGE
jgi:hypothetical protein